MYHAALDLHFYPAVWTHRQPGIFGPGCRCHLRAFDGYTRSQQMQTQHEPEDRTPGVFRHQRFRIQAVPTSMVISEHVERQGAAVSSESLAGGTSSALGTRVPAPGSSGVVGL